MDLLYPDVVSKKLIWNDNIIENKKWSDIIIPALEVKIFLDFDNFLLKENSTVDERKYWMEETWKKMNPLQRHDFLLDIEKIFINDPYNVYKLIIEHFGSQYKKPILCICADEKDIEETVLKFFDKNVDYLCEWCDAGILIFYIQEFLNWSSKYKIPQNHWMELNEMSDEERKKSLAIQIYEPEYSSFDKVPFEQLLFNYSPLKRIDEKVLKMVHMTEDMYNIFISNDLYRRAAAFHLNIILEKKYDGNLECMKDGIFLDDFPEYRIHEICLSDISNLKLFEKGGIEWSSQYIIRNLVMDHVLNNKNSKIRRIFIYDIMPFRCIIIHLP